MARKHRPASPTPAPDAGGVSQGAEPHEEERNNGEALHESEERFRTLAEARAELEKRLAEFEQANLGLRDSRRAALNLMEDAVRARQETEQLIAALRESEERFRTLVSVITDVPWVTDAAGAFFELQSAWEAYTGQAWEEHRGFGWTNALHPDDREVMRTIWERACAARSLYQSQGRVWHAPTQQYRYFVARATPLLNADWSVREWVGAYTDVHALKLQEETLRRLNDELEQRVAERTSELAQSEDRLRTLATELNLAEQRERTRFATELHDYLAQLLVLGRMTLARAKQTGLSPSAEGLVKEAEETLDEALIYCRTLMAELSPPVLHEHGLSAGLTWLGEHMKRQDLTVIIEVDEAGHVPLPPDRAVLLFQSVRELLINVAKHGAIKEVTVRMTYTDGVLCIVVRDENGFDLTAATNISPLSSKFGLFSIRERMKTLDGSFDIRSAPGQGTTATLLLPLATSSELKILGSELSVETTDHRRAAIGSQSAHSELQKNATIRVLLVDDHTLLRQGLLSIVSAYNHLEVVGEASDGVEAVELAQRLCPDVIVMDINMPRMDGIEATKRIKANRPETIVIGLSVNQSADMEQRMKAVGMTRYLTKESAADALCHAIEAAVAPKGYGF